jgi:Trypsin-like peptidase domain
VVKSGLDKMVGKRLSTVVLSRRESMQSKRVFLFFLLVLPLASRSTTAQEFNTVLMESTFKIMGAKRVTPETKVEPGKVEVAFGTMFVVGKPSRIRTGVAYNVLVTAAHVLESIEGDTAIIVLRKKNADGTFQRFLKEIKIRERNRPLYTSHPEVDIAVTYLPLPKDTPITLVPTSYLATDKTYEEYEIHPGDQLFCLGYPLFGESSEAGFPILRSGRIASYPLVPAKRVKRILYDFHIYEGNSGGPVYMSESGRVYKHEFHLRENTRFVVGLVSKQLSSIPELGSQRLELAEVVPAEFILEMINSLPDLEAK